MGEIQRTNGSGRLSAQQMRFLNKITAAGKEHPNKRKYYMFLLVIVLLWFYLLSFCKKHAAVLTAILCGGLFILRLYYAFMPG